MNKAIGCILKTKARLLREAYLNTSVHVTKPELPWTEIGNFQSSENGFSKEHGLAQVWPMKLDC